MTRKTVLDTAGAFVFEVHGLAAVMVEAPASIAASASPMPVGGESLEKINDWGNQRQPRRKEALLLGIKAAGFAYEFPYDAAHGRRYCLAEFQRSGGLFSRAPCRSFGRGWTRSHKRL